MSARDDIDPRGVIGEAFKMEELDAAQCRSIFLDWALSLPVDADCRRAIQVLLKRHGAQDHPMKQVLEEGLGTLSGPRRRGGWRARNRPH